MDKCVDFKVIGKRIRARRVELKMTQQRLSELCGVNDRYISNIENAYSKMSIEALARICRSLQTTPDHILLGAEKITEDETSFTNILHSKLKLLPITHKKFIVSFLEWFINYGIKMK